MNKPNYRHAPVLPLYMQHRKWGWNQDEVPKIYRVRRRKSHGAGGQRLYEMIAQRMIFIPPSWRQLSYYRWASEDRKIQELGDNSSDRKEDSVNLKQPGTKEDRRPDNSMWMHSKRRLVELINIYKPAMKRPKTMISLGIYSCWSPIRQIPHYRVCISLRAFSLRSKRKSTMTDFTNKGEENGYHYNYLLKYHGPGIEKQAWLRFSPNFRSSMMKISTPLKSSSSTFYVHSRQLNLLLLK